MGEWLLAKSLFGLPRWGILAIAVAAIAAGVFMFNRTVDKTLQTITTTSEQVGETKAVVAGQATTLQQVGAANEASIDYRNDSGLGRFCECLYDSTADTAGNCVRYLQHKPVPGGPPPSGADCPRP